MEETYIRAELFQALSAYHLAGRWHPGEHARSRLLKGFEVPVAPLLGEQPA